jgi:hypothetical protein
MCKSAPCASIRCTKPLANLANLPPIFGFHRGSDQEPRFPKMVHRDGPCMPRDIILDQSRDWLEKCLNTCFSPLPKNLAFPSMSWPRRGRSELLPARSKAVSRAEAVVCSLLRTDVSDKVQVISMAFQAWLRVTARVLATGAILSVGNLAMAADEPNLGASNALASYELGHGLRLGESGFTVGGYSAVQVQNTPYSDSGVSLSHLSMFLWWENQSRLKLFSEFDRENESAVLPHQAGVGEIHFLTVERLYFDYTPSDLLTLRAGKFLTPVGRWNINHADPLVWTTSRPLITSDLFPDNAMGVMALGNVQIMGRDADYAIYAASSHDLRTEPGKDPFNKAYGGRLNLAVAENMQLGFSYLSFNQRGEPDEQKQLAGFDFFWASQGYELTGEAAYRMSSEGAQRDIKGYFIQGVAPLSERFFAVGRIESISRPDIAKTARLSLLGINYRASRAVSLKLEFIHGVNTDIGTPVGFLSSVSVLF